MTAIGLEIRRGWAAAVVVVTSLASVVGTAPAPAHATRPSAPPPLIETYAVENPNPAEGRTLFVTDGGVWARTDDDVRRVDLDAGPLTGYLDFPMLMAAAGAPRMDRGMYWTIVVDPDAAPCSAPIPEVDPQRPYVLHGIDLATNTVTRVVPLPEWCAARPSRTWTGEPMVAAGDGIVWVGRALPHRADGSIGSANVRVDGATGAVSDVAAAEPLVTFAADDGGAWGYSVVGGEVGANAAIGLSLLPVELTRIGRDGTVVAAGRLRGVASDLGSMALDPRGMWLVTARTPTRPDVRPDTSLTRVTRAGRRVVAPGIHPWSVASGDGQTWFLGTPSSIRSIGNTSNPRPVDWVLGRIDTDTGKLLRTYHLELPPGLGQVTTDDGTPAVQLLAVTGGSIWLRAGDGAGTLVRVTFPSKIR